jgi:hypothetical protein
MRDRHGHHKCDTIWQEILSMESRPYIINNVWQATVVTINQTHARIVARGRLGVATLGYKPSMKMLP